MRLYGKVWTINRFFQSRHFRHVYPHPFVLVVNQHGNSPQGVCYKINYLITAYGTTTVVQSSHPPWLRERIWRRCPWGETTPVIKYCVLPSWTPPAIPTTGSSLDPFTSTNRGNPTHASHHPPCDSFLQCRRLTMSSKLNDRPRDGDEISRGKNENVG